MENTTLNGTTTKEQDWKQKKGYTPLIVLITILLGTAFYAGQICGTSVAGGSGTGEMGTTTPNLVREGVSNGDAGQEDFSSTSVGDNYVTSVTNSFAEDEDEGGGLLGDCYSGPCYDRSCSDVACEGRKGCYWYPHWGSGRCSSCSGVSCGEHRAVECSRCNYYGGTFPAKKGKTYCNGECKWHNVHWYVTAVTGRTSFCEPK